MQRTVDAALSPPRLTLYSRQPCVVCLRRGTIGDALSNSMLATVVTEADAICDQGCSPRTAWLVLL